MRVPANFAPIWETVDTAGHSTRGGGAFGRGRKRSRSGDIEGEDEAELSPPTSPRKKPHARVDTKDQYFVAGHDPDQPLPSAAFPHSPIPRKRGVPAQESETAFAELNPPLYAAIPSREEGRPSIKQQHMAVMNEILHVSLLRGDYQRAGQVFGLLLRVTSSTFATDIRRNCAWGIGAEILLRQDKSRRSVSGRASSPSLSDDDDQDNTELEGQYDSKPPLSADGIATAKRYYESLIVQYPFDKLHPTSTDARTFYPALFSLMIYQASEGAKTALAQLPSQSNPDDSEPESMSQDDERQAAVADIKREEISAAHDIGDRIDEVLRSPPYDRFAPLLRIRGMVALWEADLLEALFRADANTDDVDHATQEIASRLREKAKVMLHRTVDVGGLLPKEIEDTLI